MDLHVWACVTEADGGRDGKRETWKKWIWKYIIWWQLVNKAVGFLFPSQVYYSSFGSLGLLKIKGKADHCSGFRSQQILIANFFMPAFNMPYSPIFFRYPFSLYPWPPLRVNISGRKTEEGQKPLSPSGISTKFHTSMSNHCWDIASFPFLYRHSLEVANKIKAGILTNLCDDDPNFMMAGQHL